MGDQKANENLFQSNFPLLFQMAFLKPIPNTISSNFTFALEIPWDFAEHKANEIFSGTQNPLGISKGILLAIHQSKSGPI